MDGNMKRNILQKCLHLKFNCPHITDFVFLMWEVFIYYLYHQLVKGIVDLTN
jgi:hypothetical protein